MGLTVSLCGIIGHWQEEEAEEDVPKGNNSQGEQNRTAPNASGAASTSAAGSMGPGTQSSSGAAAAVATQTKTAGADREAGAEKSGDQLDVVDEPIFDPAGAAASLRGNDDDLRRGLGDDIDSDDEGEGDDVGWGVLPVSDLVDPDALSLEQFHDGLYHDLSDMTEGLDDDFYASLAAL